MYISHDIKLGIIHQWKKYMLVFLLFLFFCVNLYINSTCYSYINIQENTPTFIDYFMFVFEGIEPYQKLTGNYFRLPLTWMLCNLMLAYIIGDYTTKELKHYSDNVLTRVGSRKKWWLAKCFWNILSVASFYTIGYITILIFSLFTTGKLLFIPRVMAYMFTTNNFSMDLSQTQFIFATIFLPIVVSIAISLMQMTMSIICNSVLSYILTVAFLVSSVFLNNVILIAGASMLVRNSVFNDIGNDSTIITIASVIISIASIAIGHFHFEKKDILSIGQNT